MYTILHISDLHRAPDDPITNHELLSCLRVDRLRYSSEEPPISSPDAIVVSGDIIQGVPLGTSDYEHALRTQYLSAEEFLGMLCDEFLKGDRARLVIVPGNHDVDWNTSRAAMQEVPASHEPRPQEVFREDSIYRWDWKTRRFFQIMDATRYGKRLDAFWEMAERFYAGVPGIPRFVKGSDYNIFQLCGGRIGVAAFNSCHGNDCFAYHGAIRRPSISECHLEMGSLPHLFELWIAVWHHSIDGPPYRTDYMDFELVQNMIGRGYRLGLFGHQHRNQAEPRRVYLPDRETMGVISAGSLCAGSRELPTGFFRQYNVIEIADDLRSARVHVRQMETAQLFSRAHLTLVGGRSYVDLEWDTPVEVANRVAVQLATPHARLVLQAERYVKNLRYQDAVNALRPVAQELDSYGRAILFDALRGANDWGGILELAMPPRSLQELVFLVDAGDRSGAVALSRDALMRHGDELQLPDALRKELEKRLSIREAQQR